MGHIDLVFSFARTGVEWQIRPSLFYDLCVPFWSGSNIQISEKKMSSRFGMRVQISMIV